MRVSPRALGRQASWQPVVRVARAQAHASAVRAIARRSCGPKGVSSDSLSVVDSREMHFLCFDTSTAHRCFYMLESFYMRNHDSLGPVGHATAMFLTAWLGSRHLGSHLGVCTFGLLDGVEFHLHTPVFSSYGNIISIVWVPSAALDWNERNYCTLQPEARSTNVLFNSAAIISSAPCLRLSPSAILRKYLRTTLFPDLLIVPWRDAWKSSTF